MKIIKVTAENLHCINCDRETHFYLNRDNYDGKLYTEYRSGVKNTDKSENMFTDDSMPVQTLHWNYHAGDGLHMYIEFECGICGTWTEVELEPGQYTLETVEN